MGSSISSRKNEDEMSQVDGLVSVVIPTFNQGHFLQEALRSVINQTYRKWEAIVVNNYSTDNTSAVVSEFNDSRIVLIEYANLGVIARSRNVGISNCRGEYVAFLDSDDLWEPTKLERSLEVLSKGVDLVCHAERWFGGGSPDRIVRYGPASRATYRSLLIEGNCISTSATVVRHSVLAELSGFRDSPSLITTEDYDLWLRIAQRGSAIEFIDDVLGSFRRHNASASSAHQRHLAAELAVIDDHFRANAPLFDSLRRKRVALAYYSAGRICTRGGNTRDGISLFGQSLLYNPTRLKTWIAFLMHLTSSVRLPIGERRHEQ